MAAGRPVVTFDVETTAAWPTFDPQTGRSRVPGTGPDIAVTVDPRDVCDARDDDEARGRKNCAQFGLQFEPTLDGLLARADIDAVIIATPDATHAPLALECLRAGKHVLVEKPLAATVEEARAMVTTARRYGRTVAVGHVERFNPAWRSIVTTLV